MFKFLAVAALAAGIAVPATAATVIYDFNTVAIGPNNAAYAPGFTIYNTPGAVGPATVAGVTFSGTSGVDSGAFGFPSDGSQTAFLQSYPGLTDGSLTLASGAATAGKTYTVSFDSAARPSGGSAITVSEGATLLGTFNPGSGFATTTFSFTSSGLGALTFAAVNSGGSDLSTALDNVSISTVPEPATWGLMVIGFGLVGVGVRRKTAFTA